MPRSLHCSPQSQLDLDEIRESLSLERGDSVQEEKVVSDILSAVEKLPGRETRYPLVGALPFVDDDTRFMTVGDYVVFYRIQGEAIFIDRILCKHCDWASQF